MHSQALPARNCGSVKKNPPKAQTILANFYAVHIALTPVTGGPKGYLKCDINVITKGDAVKIPPKSERDEDDIEA